VLVLDTHAALWWTLEPARLGRLGRSAIGEADRIGIPTIVFWETAVLVRKRKLELSISVAEWAAQLLSIPRVEPLQLTVEVALRADSLVMHGDPADRFIVATALAESSRLVTKDALLRQQGLVKTIW
jgi:PIN domain nuclease of toxin-antitoxin system